MQIVLLILIGNWLHVSYRIDRKSHDKSIVGHWLEWENPGQGMGYLTVYVN